MALPSVYPEEDVRCTAEAYVCFGLMHRPIAISASRAERAQSRASGLTIRPVVKRRISQHRSGSKTKPQIALEQIRAALLAGMPSRRGASGFELRQQQQPKPGPHGLGLSYVAAIQIDHQSAPVREDDPEPPEQVALDSTHVKVHRCASGGKGASEQAIGPTKGGRNSNIRARVDKSCRPWALILTPGNVAGCTMGPACVATIDGITKLGGDKGCDSNSFRKLLREDGITAVIPGRSNRKKRIRYDTEAYKDRNVIERFNCRIKDFRRIATRYDKLTRTSFPPCAWLRR